MISGKALLKRKTAVLKALSLVEGEERLGVGSGSTMGMLLQELSNATRAKGLEIKIVPSSSQVELECSRLGLKMSSLYENPRLEVVVDSADEADAEGNLLKGGGAALTREKVLYSAANKVVIVLEEEKRVGRLGEKHAIPVEVLPFSMPYVAEEIGRSLSVEPRVRTLAGKAGPLVTDNGNYVLDVPLGGTEGLSAVDTKLRTIPGVIETGIFFAKDGFLVVGTDQGVTVMETKAILDRKEGGRIDG
ncbi:MAG TPA: ribose 5-phosphate isomerase A [Thermoproteota archaeon]|nr:ribose 5-phosphate isomerase A [Thermoproteota archaeon]